MIPTSFKEPYYSAETAQIKRPDSLPQNASSDAPSGTYTILPGHYHPHSTWRESLKLREAALRNQHMRAHKRQAHTKRLQPLVVGNKVHIQNQFGKYPTKWDKTGVVIEVRQHDQCVVKIDGAGRMITRNSKFLRKYLPVLPTKPSITINTDIDYKRILENPGIRHLPFKNSDPPAPCPPTPEHNYELPETPMSSGVSSAKHTTQCVHTEILINHSWTFTPKYVACVERIRR